MTLLTVQNVWKYYGKSLLLQDVCIEIQRGRMIGIVGDNGVGKTTLLKMMAGLIHPDRGLIIRECSAFSYVLSAEHFYPWMRVRDGIVFYGDHYHDFDAKKAERLLEEAGIGYNARINRLSRGQQERFCLILGLSRGCSLYLMDESFGGIDPFYKRDTKRFLLENMQEESTIVMITHLLKDMEMLFDEILFVTDKTVMQIETEQIRLKYGKSVEQYYMEELTHE